MSAETQSVHTVGRGWSAGRSVGQLILAWAVLWGVSFAVLPPVERLYRIGAWTLGGTTFAWAVFSMATALGVWAAASPEWFPVDHPVRLVVSGPYRRLRNPMAVATVAQGLALAWARSSVLSLAYVAVAWIASEWTLRPAKDSDLVERFGEAGRRYLTKVPRWVPSLRPYACEGA